MTAHSGLGPGREFDAVRRLLALWGDAAGGIGDDAAVLDVPSGERLVVSADSTVESFHFRRDWLSARAVGWRATVSALSDLAAMAATPLGVLVSLSLPESWRADLDELARGIGEAVQGAGTRIVGGDLTAANELAIAVTVLGHTAAPLTRAGACPGDTLYATGMFGGPRAAIEALLHGEEPSPLARERFEHPMPRIREARWLAAHGAHALIDVSDGLAGDAGHIAAASGVTIELTLDTIPTISGSSPLEAASSGEEYELLIAAPRLDTSAFERELGLPLTAVGRVVSGEPVVRAWLAGERVALPGGFDHFS
ncbi:MAG TPA: thiamine-phosphate kinase [Gemmatimonadaceae bacterium]|nr:thiamine-phosphate kinase [Gemmatimonadaceae bacterium]